MTRLAGIAARHRSALLFDFRRFVKKPFNHVLSGRIPLSEAAALVDELLRNPESAIAREVNDQEPPWVTGDYLLAHVYQALTGEKHPALPNRKRAAAMRDPKRQAAINRAKNRAAERAHRIATGELT